MRKNNVHTRRERGRLSNPVKPALLTLAIAQALAFQAVQAASIEVTSNLDDGTDCTLREAIETVNAGVDLTNGCIINGALGTADAISFGAGVSGSTIVTNGELIIGSSVVSINSGGAPTTIDANGVGRVIGVYSSTVELDQLTLTGGYSFSGGGIYAGEFSTVTLTNSTVSGNTAYYGGGGIYSSGDDVDVTLTNSTVSGNTANYVGGGIFAVNRSAVTLTNSTVSSNSAGGVGGGIFAVNRSAVTLTNSTVSGNSGFNCGGIYSSGYVDVTLTNSTVSSNSARNVGGGIMTGSYSSVTLTDSTMSGNTANYSGGGIFAVNFTSVTLMNSTVSGNSAGDNGGGIYTSNRSPLTLTNSTVSGNTAGSSGGGIHAYDSSVVTLTNSTVSGNTGQGIYADSYFDVSVTLSNSIVANSLVTDCTTSGSVTITATADSIIEDGSCGTTAMAVDPLLGPLADNGGPTQTHALLAGSPAIDNGTGPGATTFDQRGVAAEGVRDSGAYEFTAAINALTIDKLINNQARETQAESAQLLAGSLYRQKYTVTNTSQDRLYQVRVFEGGNLVCNVYTLDPGETKERCNTVQTVLAGDQHVEVTVNAKVSGTSDTVSAVTDAYYTGISNAQGQMQVTHYINNRNADTPGQAQTLASQQTKVLFKIENTGEIELYRVKTYHDPVSPVNSGWAQQCVIGPLKPGQVRYCKKDITLSEPGLNHAVGRARGVDAFASPTGVIRADNPTYFIVP